MTDKEIIIDGKECRYWFRPNPDDYRKCSLRGKNDNCDEITDCFIKELLGKLALKEQECEELKQTLNEIKKKIAEIIHSLDDYNQALIDIEEILKQGIKIHDNIIVNKQILQKAREVENAR